MKRIGVATALLLAACAPRPPSAPPPAVELAARAVCRPAFTADGSPHEAGTGFLLEARGRRLLVTAHHLFGPAGGLPRQIAPEDLPRRIAAVRCTALDGGRTWTAGPPVDVPGAHPIGMPVQFRDVAVLPLASDTPAAEPGPLRLAAESPRKGDTVWLLASAGRGGALAHAARVNTVQAGVLAVVFEERGIDPGGADGAPFVNAAGEVVGSHVAAGKLRAPDQVTGFANSLDALRGAVADARLRP